MVYSINLSFLLSLGFMMLHAGLGASGSTTIKYDNGFGSANLILDGVADIMANGVLRLTNETQLVMGHALYPDPIPFKQSQDRSVLSFSTTFVFGIITQYPNVSAHGLMFIITPNTSLPHSLPSQYLGVFNDTNNGNTTNHVVGVEFDTNQSLQFNETNNNHVGIDINDLESVKSIHARYFVNNTFVNISLSNGEPIQAWIEYDESNKQMDVTLAPININKPAIPSLTLSDLDLSPFLHDTMYIGFSAATGSSVSNSHYILGWSFALDEPAPPLNISSLPKLPESQQPSATPTHNPSNNKKILTIGISTIVPLIIISFGILYIIQRMKKFSEVLEDWESEYGPHRFKYKDLYVATKGFRDKELVGTGGFGKVYKGTLPESKIEVAVKKVSHDSRQGMKEFVAEIVSMGRLRHRNLVQLLGYCRRKGELLLVYEYMNRGSLDRFLHRNNNSDPTLNWEQRFNIIKGVASGLLYLHEGWEQIVVHRDIKASNILLDSDMNPRLGDFGLARLHDHNSDPQTTHVMGTLGYLAPEYSRTGKATQSSDVFAFGAFMLEVVCGRRPIDLVAPRGESLLVDTVFRCWKRGCLLMVVDPHLRRNYVHEEAEAVLKLGLLCSNVEAGERPTMREMVAFLDGVVAMPDLKGLELGSGGVSFLVHASHSTSDNLFFTRSTSITESQLSEAR